VSVKTLFNVLLRVVLVLFFNENNFYRYRSSMFNIIVYLS